MTRRNRVGETVIAANGQKMTITEDYGWRNLTVQFEDGTIKKNIQYNNFKKGYVKNPNAQNTTNTASTSSKTKSEETQQISVTAIDTEKETIKNSAPAIIPKKNHKDKHEKLHKPLGDTKTFPMMMEKLSEMYGLSHEALQAKLGINKEIFGNMYKTYADKRMPMSSSIVQKIKTVFPEIGDDFFMATQEEDAQETLAKEENQAEPTPLNDINATTMNNSMIPINSHTCMITTTNDTGKPYPLFIVGDVSIDIKQTAHSFQLDEDVLNRIRTLESNKRQYTHSAILNQLLRDGLSKYGY